MKCELYVEFLPETVFMYFLNQCQRLKGGTAEGIINFIVAVVLLLLLLLLFDFYSLNQFYGLKRGAEQRDTIFFMLLLLLLLLLLSLMLLMLMLLLLSYFPCSRLKRSYA